MAKPTKTNRPLTDRLIAAAGSRRFFWGIIAFLVLQAAWIALSGRYPMAFDEDFHLGVIRLYAHHLSPFWSAQPIDGDAFGAVTRDPSYLFHYLMSFPYRLVSALTSSETAQVLTLRAINIGLFAFGLSLYRRLLLRTGAPKAIVNLSLLIFVLVPIVPLLAAQINYDNLLMPLVALVMLLALRLYKGSSKQVLDVKTLAQLVSVCLLTSLVKYAFLPVFLAVVSFIIIRFWRLYDSPVSFMTVLVCGWQQIARRTKWVLLILLVLATGLFAERFGVNLIRYHRPAADCGQVLSYEHCQHYGPWLRDYHLSNSRPANAESSPIAYTQHWFYGMWFRSFFAVDGPGTHFQTRGPLIIPGVSVIVFATLGVLAMLLAAKRLWRRYNTPVLWLFTSVSLIYTGVLWFQQYQLFRRTGQPVAINGRYLLPLLPILVLTTALALNELLGPRRRLKTVITAVAVICFAWGGGAMTYVLRSNDAWYWPSTPLKSANHALQDSLGPLTPGYHKPTQFLH